MTVEYVYFKENGKYYTSEYYESKYELFPDIINEACVLQRNNQLPGLQSVRWEGYLTVTYKDVPHILNFRKAD